MRGTGDLVHSNRGGERVRLVEVIRLLLPWMISQNGNSFACTGSRGRGWAGQVAQAKLERDRNMISFLLSNCRVGRSELGFGMDAGEKG